MPATIIDRCSECGHYGAVLEIAPGTYICESCEAELRAAGELEEDVAGEGYYDDPDLLTPGDYL